MMTMTEQATMVALTDEGRVALAQKLRDIHSDFTLEGKAAYALLKLPDEQLLYVLSVLRNELPLMPEMTADEWHAMFNILTVHWIAPLFYRNLRQVPEDLLPPADMMKKFRTSYMYSTRNSLLREKQLGAIVDAFRKNGLRVIVLKGLAYSLSLYEKPELRPSMDIDLMVNAGDVVHCRSLLEGLGYKCVEQRIETSIDGYCEEVFTPDSTCHGYVPVDVHWKLYPYAMVNAHVDVGQLFSRARAVKTRCGDLEVLDPVDAIIHAASHMIYNHGHGIRLNWIYDIYLLCRKLRSPEDWEILKNRSVEFGARLAVEEALTMARYWTGLRIPPGFDDFSLWPVPGDVESVAFSSAIGGRTRDQIRMVIPRSASLNQKLRLLLRLVFPSGELMNVLPDTRGKPLPLAYLIRWWRLLKKI